MNPKNVLVSSDDDDSPENIYKNAYVCYIEEDYEYALESINKVINSIKGEEIEPKYELLKAYLIYKTEGDEAFQKKLNSIVIDYPTTEEGKHAKAVLEKMQTKSIEK